MTVRAVEEEHLLREVRRVVREVVGPDVGADRVNELAAGVVERLRPWVAERDRAPRLVGPVAAAKILGVQPPHLARLRRQGRMPEAIPVEGTNDVYVREDVEALAKTLAAERAARAKRQKEKADAA